VGVTAEVRQGVVDADKCLGDDVVCIVIVVAEAVGEVEDVLVVTPDQRVHRVLVALAGSLDKTRVFIRRRCGGGKSLGYSAPLHIWKYSVGSNSRAKKP
jgi:hypothetical protein